ncbi:histidine triad nucleotide-binding protein [Sulfurovum sp. ST-21]|uniref:Histidine triad nucleotide-binding protein n=1 Tax=Sulfurovum indicum TaxID=2779528 RepID=A0A7M1S222_9BACT|nr:histidine triad nucleotide-binding protein [Sulfurovum indicum]QOR61418.1 histidine triad nucleotide-binding protein [Sulfurovum indicum]
MCIFCKIVNGEIPNNTVHENEQFLAFHDLYPKAPVHILVIPKQHVDCFQDVQPEVMAGMTMFIQEVAKKTGLDKTGYRLVANNGEDGGQEVMHLHFHILGGGKLRWDHSHEDPHKSI